MGRVCRDIMIHVGFNLKSNQWGFFTNYPLLIIRSIFPLASWNSHEGVILVVTSIVGLTRAPVQIKYSTVSRVAPNTFHSYVIYIKSHPVFSTKCKKSATIVFIFRFTGIWTISNLYKLPCTCKI